MALQPSNSGTVWEEDVGLGSVVAAGYVKDGSGNFSPSVTGPFDGRVLDIAGDGNFVLTDVSAGVPAFVAELHLAYMGGAFITYL